MLKSFNQIYIFYPMIINLILILLIMMPSNKISPSPMFFLIMLILLTFLITLKMKFLFYSWLPFILFLMMIGGLMIIYLYVTSLSNNEYFFNKLKFNLMNLIKILPALTILIMMIMNFEEINMFTSNYLDSWTMNLNPKQKNFNLLFMKNINKSTYFIMFYLYYSMICIMNICYKFKAPLRQMMF